MASTGAYGSPDDIRNVFMVKLEREWKQRATCRRQYVLVHRLRAWMTSTEEGQRSTNVGRLLRAVYKPNPRFSFQPVDSKQISDNLLVFAILLSKDLGDLIHHFKRASITDSMLALPSLDYQGLERGLKDDMAYAKEVQEIFDRERWAFCPAEIGSDMERTYFTARSIFPFCSQEPINEKGGTAQVYQVLIQEDFVSPDMRLAMVDSKLKHSEFGMCYQLALKCYHVEDLYEWETEAFLALRGVQGMVQCICSYSLGASGELPRDNTGTALPQTHNILLEFGELDLDEFFADSDPPAHPLEIIGFWEKFFKLAEALHKLHYPERRNRDGSREPLHGWHADVKPDNILRVHGEFKLADFGFAKFKKRHQEVPREYIEGGTQSYGAPELDRGRQIRGTRTAVSQTIDTWSFGCVLSVAVTWVVLGYQGILQYEKLRTTAISKLRQHRERGHKDLQVPTADDAFHNASVVLPEVLNWFDYLNHGLRRSDFVSGRVLKLVKETMLLKEPDHRLKSPDLCERLSDILVNAQHDLQEQLGKGKVEPITPIILEILQNDISTPSSSNSAATQTSSDSARNANALHISMQGTIPSSQQRLLSAPSSWEQKRIGKSERLEKRPHLKTAHRVQPSQVYPTISKRSTGASSISNPALPDKAPFSESPTDVAKPVQPASIGDEIPSLFSKGANAVENNEFAHFMRERSDPTVIVSTPEKVETPKKLDSGPSTNSVNTPVKPKSFEDKETAPVLPDPGSPQGMSSPGIKWPIVAPSGFDDLPTLQFLHRNLQIFQVREDLVSQGAGRSRTIFRKPKKDEFLKKFIKDRDIIFVIDNAASMRSRWPIATYTAETLAMKVANLDDDGIEFVFTTGGHENDIRTARSSNAGQTIRKAMEVADPEQCIRNGMQPSTDMSSTLHKVFNYYKQTGKMKSKTVTLLVFTDGVWGLTKEKTVETKIQEFAGKVQQDASEAEQGSGQARSSIEFISFGQDTKGITRLQYLDDDLAKDYGIHDVIDTEPWSGKVSKMILGSIAEEQFQDDPDESPGPASPPGLMPSGGLASPPPQELPITPFSRSGTTLTEKKKRRSFNPFTKS